MSIEHDIQMVRFMALWEGVFATQDKTNSAVLSVYSDAIDKTITALESATGYSKKRLDALLVNLEESLAAYATQSARYTAQQSGTLGATVGKQTENILSWDGRLATFNNVSMTAEQITGMIYALEFAGENISSLFDSAFNSDNVIAAARSGLARGVNPVKVTRELIKQFNVSDPANRRDIETLIKSYMASAANSSSNLVYDANKDIINKYEWSAVLENSNLDTGRGTCTRCKALDGKQYAEIADAPSIPLHARCRCQLTPVTKTWDELGIDADEAEETYRPAYERALDSGVAGKRTFDYQEQVKVNYNEWWLGKSEKWRVNAIGPGRNEWVMAGKDKAARMSRFGRMSIGDKKTLSRVNSKTNGSKYKLGDLIRIEDL